MDDQEGGLPTQPRGSPAVLPSASLPLAPAFELTGASVLWGFGFIATRWALGAAGPLWVSALRFGLAAFLSALVITGWRGFRIAVTVEQFRLAAWPGFLLATSLVLQTVGLRYTTATNSSFITTLYVVFVPVLSWILRLHAVPKNHFVVVAIALFGTALMCELHTIVINVGDLLTLGCAVLSAGHIVVLSFVGPRVRSPFVLNAAQVLWAFVLTAPVTYALEGPLEWRSTLLANLGLAFLVIGSSTLAFVLQIRAQRELNPAVASLLCLLESPFAALFAFTLLSERLGWLQWIGAALILFAAVLAIREEPPPADR